MCRGGTQIERWALAATQRFVCRAAGLSLLGSLCALVDSRGAALGTGRGRLPHRTPMAHAVPAGERRVVAKAARFFPIPPSRSPSHAHADAVRDRARAYICVLSAAAAAAAAPLLCFSAALPRRSFRFVVRPLLLSRACLPSAYLLVVGQLGLVMVMWYGRMVWHFGGVVCLPMIRCWIG